MEEEVKEVLTKSIINGREGFKNKELDEKAEHVRKCEYGALIAREYEKTLKNERKNTIRIASKEGYVLNKFKKKKK